MKQYKAIIYDIDGTLLNTLDMNMYPLMRIIKEEKGEDWTFEQVLRFASQPGMKTLADLGIRDIDRVYARWVTYVNSYGDGAVPFAGVAELLAAVKGLGIRQAVVSAKRVKQYGIDMGRPGFDKYMEAAVLFDDTAKHKPDPEPLLECLRRLGLGAEEALYVGDARSDYQASQNAGMDFAYARWGSISPAGIDSPTYDLAHPMELVKILKG